MKRSAAATLALVAFVGAPVLSPPTAAAGAADRHRAAGRGGHARPASRERRRGRRRGQSAGGGRPLRSGRALLSGRTRGCGGAARAQDPRRASGAAGSARRATRARRAAAACGRPAALRQRRRRGPPRAVLAPHVREAAPEHMGEDGLRRHVVPVRHVGRRLVRARLEWRFGRGSDRDGRDRLHGRRGRLSASGRPRSRRSAAGTGHHLVSADHDAARSPTSRPTIPIPTRSAS